MLYGLLQKSQQKKSQEIPTLWFGIDRLKSTCWFHSFLSLRNEYRN